MSTFFRPDFAIPPGETLAETIESIGLTQTELARRMGRPIKTINEIIQGKTALTADTALELERVLGTPAHIWNNLESQYRESLARQRASEAMDVDEDWLAGLPIKEMQKRGWIGKAADKPALMECVLCFFGVAGVEEWKAVWQEPVVAFRKSPSFKSEIGVLSAWLRKAETEGRKQQCRPYNAAAFTRALGTIRTFTTRPPGKWVTLIQAACNVSGVAYVLLPELPGGHVSGATRWLNDSCALIVQTGRYRDDGHFWFTFFHEARHVLQGKQKREWQIEFDGKSDELESDANRFAREFLVPSEKIAETRRVHGGKLPVAAAKQLAKELGIAEGIVAGRFQHDKIWKSVVGNEMKQRYNVGELLGRQSD